MKNTTPNLSDHDSSSKLKHNGIIFFINTIIFFLLLYLLPFTPNENKGLALLAFIGIYG